MDFSRISYTKELDSIWYWGPEWRTGVYGIDTSINLWNLLKKIFSVLERYDNCEYYTPDKINDNEVLLNGIIFRFEIYKFCFTN